MFRRSLDEVLDQTVLAYRVSRFRVEVHQVLIVPVSAVVSAPCPETAVFGPLKGMMIDASLHPNGLTAGVKTRKDLAAVEVDQDGGVDQHRHAMRLQRRRAVGIELLIVDWPIMGIVAV